MCQYSELLLAGSKRRFRLLAFGQLIGRDIDADDRSVRAVHRMPIDHP